MCIEIRPAQLRQFGPPRGAVFCVITNPSLADALSIVDADGYNDVQVLLAEEATAFNRLLVESVPRRAHVLVISPDVFFRSPPPDVLGPERKLLGMACNSTPTTPATIAHFLGIMEQTAPEEQEAMANEFFERARTAKSLELVDERWGVRATFQHLDESYEWNQQAGSLDWGEQQIAPAGELSVLPMNIQELEATRSLQLDGRVALQGCPILHSGSGSFERDDQARLHEQLATMDREAIIAWVENGVITRTAATGPASGPAQRTLEALFAGDSRYRTLWEIGFAINTAHQLLPGNHAMNEVYGGRRGAIHWGFGLTPYTQYHLDVISPGTTVYDERGHRVFGAD